MSEELISNAIKNIDLSQVTEDQVVADIINESRQFAFRMALASTILDIIRKPKEADPERPENMVVS